MGDIRYPIGEFDMGVKVTPEQITAWIKDLENTPSSLHRAVEGLSEEQLNTPYREGGWTPRQILHHIADCNMNSYIRFKLAVTEPNPTVKTYLETEWSRLFDAHTASAESSLKILEGLHDRWVIFLRSLSSNDLSRCFTHPDWGTMQLALNIGVDSFHGRHHTAQITSLRERMGWN